MNISALFGLLIFAFIAGLGFAPQEELAKKIKAAAQFAAIITALAGVVWLVVQRAA